MLKRLFKIVLGLGIMGYVGIGAYLYVYQKQFLYHPSADIKTNYSGLVLEQKSAKVYVHVLNEGHENAILYFGADSESMAKSSDYISQQFPHFTCYLMDYRSFGSSTGEPSERALYKDALKLYDTIQTKHKRISIGGRSLGSGIAMYVAAHRKVSKLALITPYESIVAIAQERYPLYPVSLLLTERYDSLNMVKAIDATTFIVMAENDRVIPKVHTQKLIDAFSKEQLTVAVIKNRGHIDISSDERYYKIMQDFIGEG
jgi:esterase/lipase